MEENLSQKSHTEVFDLALIGSFKKYVISILFYFIIPLSLWGCMGLTRENSQIRNIWVWDCSLYFSASLFESPLRALFGGGAAGRMRHTAGRAGWARARTLPLISCASWDSKVQSLSFRVCKTGFPRSRADQCECPCPAPGAAGPLGLWEATGGSAEFGVSRQIWIF